MARRYPHLHRQLAEAAALVVPSLDEWDRRALVHQNRHRWFTLLAILGGMLTTVFGALQAWLRSVPWPGVVVVTLGAATSALVVVARRQGSLHQYLVARVPRSVCAGSTSSTWPSRLRRTTRPGRGASASWSGRS